MASGECVSLVSATIGFLQNGYCSLVNLRAGSSICFFFVSGSLFLFIILYCICKMANNLVKD